LNRSKQRKQRHNQNDFSALSVTSCSKHSVAPNAATGRPHHNYSSRDCKITASRVLLALLPLLALTAGCETVKPWQREALADPIMQPDRNPIAASQLEHVYTSREAATGGATVGGGGCGCN